ncbi:HNH endonuclease signature motif containing protein [Microbacterium sp. T2.11-28]|uniref:HNH endonuclease signature motif containing protein n=1 Tax=Microbacterium sp. T2.11-28 TaxID=3041169 RepID=UPI0024779DE7|nr:HNH endonuclease signature motif containing protein [Microbacterium sp. T2.11-28]CAI9390241.1 hypothetical protein MICABA_01386 [Microbacterium sp. T2.11-28]
MTNTALLRPATFGVDAVVEELVEIRRGMAALQAREAAVLARAVVVVRAQEDVPGPSEVRDIPLRSMAAQLGAALRVSDRTVQRQLSDAVVLTERFPAAWAALAAGDVSGAHVRVIVEAGLPIDDDEARAVFEEAAVEVARRETPGRLRPAVRMLAARLHPVPLAERHAVAARGRCVWVRDLDHGMAELIATLPAHLAHGIRDRLDRYARRVIDARRGAGSAEAGAATLLDTSIAQDCRRIDEIRADVFADLLLTGHATPEVSNASIPETEAIVAHVQITVPALTALGADTTPAELTGHAPIDTATALRLAGTATGWDRVLTHPVTGTVLAVDRYRPSDQLKRTLQVRDEHCRFPGCRIPTRRCDIDHTTARQHDGPTEITNLAHLCRRHHTLKHHSAWRVRQTPDGVLHWTSPTGRQHPDRPARTLTFVPDPGPGLTTDAGLSTDRARDPGAGASDVPF